MYHCVDAARAFNIAVAFLFAGTALGGSSGQRRCALTCVLQAQRRASLRHDVADGARYVAGLQRAHDLPVVSRCSGHADHTGRCDNGVASIVAVFAGARTRDLCGSN